MEEKVDIVALGEQGGLMATKSRYISDKALSGSN